MHCCLERKSFDELWKPPVGNELCILEEVPSVAAMAGRGMPIADAISNKTYKNLTRLH